MKTQFAILLTCLLTTLSTHAALKTLTFQKDLLPREARAWEYDRASSLNTNNEVSFKLDGDPQIVDGSIQLNGIVTNTGASKKTIYIDSDKDALKIDLVPNAQVGLREPIKSKPTMFALEIPANTEVKIAGSTKLDRFTYDGSPEATLKWSFQFYSPPRPNGTLKIKLPTASEAKIAPFKIEFQKFIAQDESKLTASLRNVSNESQIFCRSPKVNFDWQLQHVDHSPAENAEKINIDDGSRPLSASDCFVLKTNDTRELETANIKKDGTTYRFETPHVTWTNLKPGQFNVRFQASNGAVGGDPGVTEAVRAKTPAAIPSEATRTTEAILPTSIP